jgi:hypothetical protein
MEGFSGYCTDSMSLEALQEFPQTCSNCQSVVQSCGSLMKRDPDRVCSPVAGSQRRATRGINCRGNNCYH